MRMHLDPTGGALTRVEKKRLQAAVKAQSGAHQRLDVLFQTTSLLNCRCMTEERQASVGTE